MSDTPGLALRRVHQRAARHPVHHRHVDWLNVPTEFVSSVVIRFCTSILGEAFWFWLFTTCRNTLLSGSRRPDHRQASDP
jgi:hypothetical protein